MERFIETVGSAWFKTTAVAFPVELLLTSTRQASNIERLKLSRAMEALLKDVIEGGLPAVRLMQQPVGNPMQYMRSQESGLMAAETTIECRSTEEVGLLHGLAAKIDHGDTDLKLKDLPAIYGEHAADRARAFQRALDAAGQAAAAIAQEAGVGLAALISARELGVDGAPPAMGEDAPRRVGVQLMARFALK